MDKIRLGISSCLLGNPVRYDGGHKLDHFLTDTLGKYVDWTPVCPEVECGMTAPREAMRLVGKPDAPRLVTIRTGIDHTDRMLRWAKKKLKDLAPMNLAGFVFKSRSPSSGMRSVKVYTSAGAPAGASAGIFAKTFMDRYPHLPVEDEGRLHDPALRENFVERVFVFHRWQGYIKEDSSRGGLVAFHTEHKLLLMAHSQKHYADLGRLVAAAKKMKRAELHDRYITGMMDGLRLLATVKKNMNVLLHMAGYFKNLLSKDEKREMQDVLGSYHQELLPLIVPITLVKHHVRKHHVEYLERQLYLNPHPLELMLRNHV